MARIKIHKKSDNEILIFQKGKEFLTTSLDIAEKFDKRHDHVLTKIEEMRKSLQKDVPYFREMSQLDSYGREQKMYEITRDGFSLLVMGFAEKKH